MSFEIRERDLLARIGRLETKSGTVETPALLPVVNPFVQPISPKAMHDEFNCQALMTNAYIIRKRNAQKALQMGIHHLLGFDGIVMTDSGAYQTLMYGDVQTTNSEIIQFQEQIDTDIATILDLPTGWGVGERHARDTVNVTLERAKEFRNVKSRCDILWTGPVQGGIWLQHVAESAKKMGKMPFQIHALGSPTPVMEQYLFDTLVGMVLTAKKHLPLERPLHLFGAGHPFMFTLAVALGCDLFDSAAYAIFAREDRYMTESGTMRLGNLEYFPCSCPECARATPEKVVAVSKQKRQEFMARHNLHVSLAEIRRIRQAITEGQLWEHLQMRCHEHPALLKALKYLGRHSGTLESCEPASKRSGLFYYESTDLPRPEVSRHCKRLSARYMRPSEANILLLLPQTRVKPFHKSREHGRVLSEMKTKLGKERSKIHVCTYAAPFGIVPTELDEVYPLSQHETTIPLDLETIQHVSKQVQSYIADQRYRRIILLEDGETWKDYVTKASEVACKRNHIAFTILGGASPWGGTILNDLMNSLSDAVSEGS